MYLKALNAVPYFSGNSEESTMMMEQSVWYGSASSPTPNGNSLNCGVMEQKPKMVEQGKTGPMHDGFNGIFGSNQEETMRTDASMAETPETCALNSSSEEVYSQILICKSNSHGETLPNDHGDPKQMMKPYQWILRTCLLGQLFDTPRIVMILGG